MSTSGHVAMYSAVSSFPAQVSQCKEPFNDASTRTRLETLKGKALKRVTVCALGGSAFPMEMIRSWLSAEMDLDIHRDYADQLPVVRKDTLYLVLSFSGNTEEVLDCATALHRSGASLCMVTNGGNLAQFAEKHNLLRIGFPDLEDGFQPRCATGYFLGFVSGLLDSIGLTVGLFDKIEMACERLHSIRPQVEAQAQRVAEAMFERKTYILSYPELAGTVGLIGRIKFNENSKIPVICDSLPEFNHNQMVSMDLTAESGTTVLLLRDWRTVGRRLHRVNVCERYFGACGIKVINLSLTGDDMFMSVLYGTWVLDFASLQLAALHGIDPQEIQAIESFKLQLNAT